MNLIKYLLAAVTVVVSIGCAPEVEIKTYPPIEELANTVWVNRTQDESGKFYNNTMAFMDDGTGTITAYAATDLNTPLSSVNFTYTFPLNDNDGLRVIFEDGARYDGYVIQKGNVQIDFKDVYLIQLFEVDESGEVILDEFNNPASTLLFWKE
ncbi:MAG: hypothetical protein J6J64_01690 [Alistipes sp.]|uniref:hypothetical protein n=1 Tax=Alistipes sp. TaxID=1872444 RepID=UPI001B65CFC6|nr:hypothetical protein [Alistipes sp.]